MAKKSRNNHRKTMGKGLLPTVFSDIYLLAMKILAVDAKESSLYWDGLPIKDELKLKYAYTGLSEDSFQSPVQKLYLMLKQRMISDDDFSDSDDDDNENNVEIERWVNIDDSELNRLLNVNNVSFSSANSRKEPVKTLLCSYIIGVEAKLNVLSLNERAICLHRIVVP
ncbi:hypothetical protein RhiirA4_446497 [Rhizophagus irregularis]|uniref:Uncharacterized protein n=1 Tax=Rhizophagus irregularis TaxID=588596 RepID=A0A2I1GVN0_9GLOM|nr:hypothetical protein RhiirA4_446497 [Rhizophagus irregularis]